MSRSRGSWLRPAVCAAVDTGILCALLDVVAMRLSPDPAAFLDSRLLVPRGLVIALVLQLCLYYNDLYEDFSWARRVELFVRVGQSFAVGGVVLTLVYYAVPPLDVGRGVLFTFLPLAFVALVAWRFSFRWAAWHEALRERVLVLGTGQSAQQIARELGRRSPLLFNVVGFLGEAEAEVPAGIAGSPIVGTTADLLEVVKARDVNLIVVALDGRRGKMPMAELLQCRLAGIRVEEATDFYERLAGNILVQNLRPSWLIFARGFDRPRVVRNAKRAGDLLGALALLVVLAPLMALVAVLVKLTSRGPVVYRQERVGENGRVFSLYKFRSMRTGAEADTGPVWAGAGDPRVTWLGRHLRRLRLDELPQLLNVLRGEMSFVGPRPERPHFVDTLRRVVPYYDERHKVKPGITGWAQIKFGYGSTIEDSERKLQFDLYYVKNMSFFLDLAIMLDTFKVMLPSRGERSPAGRDVGGR